MGGRVVVRGRKGGVFFGHFLLPSRPVGGGRLGERGWGSEGLAPGRRVLAPCTIAPCHDRPRHPPPRPPRRGPPLAPVARLPRPAGRHRRSRRDPRPLRGLGGGGGVRAVSGAGGGAAGDHGGQARHPEHADRVRQVAGRPGAPLQGAVRGEDLVLHQPHQGAGLREVLLPLRRLRPRERRHADRRRLDQPRRPDHLLHRRGARQPRPARRGSGSTPPTW